MRLHSFGDNPKQGRVAVRLGRIDSSLTAIQDLVTIAKLTVATNIRTMKPDLKFLEDMRDKLAHGLWVKHPAANFPVLQVTSGNYSDSPHVASPKARIDPRAIGVPLNALKMTVKAIDDAVRQIDRLGIEIDAALASSRHKSAQLNNEVPQRHHPRQKVRRASPRSSPA